MTAQAAATPRAGIDHPGVSNEPDRVIAGGWYTLVVMLIITLFAFIDRQLLILAAQPLAATLSLSNTQLGLVQGLAFSIFSIVAVFPITWLADRYDRRKVLGACLILWSIGTAACGLSQNFWQLFLSAIAIATGEAALAPLMSAFVPDLFKGRKRVLANSVMYIFGYIGVSLSLALGGGALGMLDRAHASLPAAMQQLESWRLAFLIVSLPLPALLLLLVRARLNGEQLGNSPGLPASTAQARAFMRPHRQTYLHVLGGLGMYLLAFGGFVVWLPLIATRLFGTTPEANGFGMGASSAAGAAVGILVGNLWIRGMMRSRGPEAAVAVAWRVLFIGIPALLYFPFVRSSVELYACMGILMIAGTGVGTLIPTILQDMAPTPFRVRFFGIWSIISALLAGSAPSVAGAMSDMIGGERGLLYSIVGLAVLGWFVAIALLKRGERSFSELAKATRGWH